MASMIRPEGKGKKIAYDILGTPPGMEKKRNKRKKKQVVEDQLLP